MLSPYLMQLKEHQKIGISWLQSMSEFDNNDGVLLAVAHNKFSMINIESLKNDTNSVVYDLKGFLPRNQVDSRL